MNKIIGIGLALAAVVYFGKSKINDYSTAFNALKVKFLGITGLTFNSGNIRFKTSLELRNTSPVDLSVDTGNSVVLRRILFYNKVGEFLGEAVPNLSAIQIPANSSVVLRNIPTEVPITDIEDLFGTAMSIFSDVKNLHIKIEMEAFGKTFMIDAT